jgi:hypothetical protein
MSMVSQCVCVYVGGVVESGHGDEYGACTHMHMRVTACMFVLVYYIYIYIYIHTHTHTQIDMYI